MQTRRGMLRGLLSGGAALMAAAGMAPGILPRGLGEEELDELLLVTGRVEWGRIEIGEVTVEVFNPHMHPVEVEGLAWGSVKQGDLYITRLEIHASDGSHSVWTR